MFYQRFCTSYWERCIQKWSVQNNFPTLHHLGKYSLREPGPYSVQGSRSLTSSLGGFPTVILSTGVVEGAVSTTKREWNTHRSDLACVCHDWILDGKESMTLMSVNRLENLFTELFKGTR